MAGIYYDPEVWNWGGKAIQGGLAGLAAKGKMNEMALQQEQLDQVARAKKANEEIAQLYAEQQEAMKNAPPIGKRPELANSEPPMDREPEEEGLAEAARVKDYETAKKEHDDAVQYRTDLAASTAKKRHDIYMKHQLPEMADKLAQQHILEAAAIGKNVGKKAGLSFLQKGPMGHMFEGMTLDDIDEDKDHFTATNFGPNHDGIMRLHKKTGEVTIVKEPTPKEETGEKYIDWGYGQKKNVKTGEIHKVPVKPDHESKANLWDLNKVRQEYNTRRAHLAQQETSLKKQLEDYAEANGIRDYDSIPNDNPAKIHLEAVRNVQKNLPMYQSNDEWLVSNKKGEPTNLYSMDKYLADPRPKGAGGNVDLSKYFTKK